MRPGVVSAVVAATVAFATPVPADTLEARLHDLLARFHGNYAFHGATAAIALPDGNLVTAAVGFADREARMPMRPDTPMLAASIGKTFVAITVLALEGEGLLSATDPVARHLGDRDWFQRLPNHATMTVRDLLRHGSGLPDHVHLETFQTEMGARIARGGAAMQPEEAIAFVQDADPLFPAGSGWAYPRHATDAPGHGLGFLTVPFCMPASGPGCSAKKIWLEKEFLLWVASHPAPA